MSYHKTVYHHQKKCKQITKSKKPCGNIALTGSDYCRMHTNLTPLQRIEKKLEAKQKRSSIMSVDNNSARYLPAQLSVREAYETNLRSVTLLDMRQEIALLQARLQQLLDSPVDNLEKQLQVIDRIEKMITSITRLELSAQALRQAEEKVRLVINKVAVVINRTVTDKDAKRTIARALFELGTSVESRNAINTKEAFINTHDDFVHVEEGEGESEARETRNGGIAKEMDQTIPSPPQSEVSEKVSLGQAPKEPIPPRDFKDVPATPIPGCK